MAKSRSQNSHDTTWWIMGSCGIPYKEHFEWLTSRLILLHMLGRQTVSRANSSRYCLPPDKR
ncbi:uncharacterized protein TrAFT101_003417 [Trichoderma asperellum]|uniref:uncharacterized protein n=1 Tax=Trichoderma asperellum TaxID=101201 RepID=UPI0033181B48|nr:hypothetical protein TrAFT101_003417 [Trichoderma asperellum]